MTFGKTDDFVCPECASKQTAKILELVSWRPRRLRCVTCSTEWDPNTSASMQREVDSDADDETWVTPADQHAE